MKCPETNFDVNLVNYGGSAIYDHCFVLQRSDGLYFDYCLMNEDGIESFCDFEWHSHKPITSILFLMAAFDEYEKQMKGKVKWIKEGF